MADVSGHRPAPTASGTLAATPLANVLIYVRNKRLSGVLELRGRDGRAGDLKLWRGRIARARSAPNVCYFGALCYELGWIDTTTLDETLREVAAKKRLHGEVLVERGAITAAQRDEALAEQATRTVHQLATLAPETAFAFYEDRPASVEPALILEPLVPAWRILRDAPPEKAIREVLAHLGGASLGMVNEAPLAKIDLSEQERAACRALATRPLTVGQLHGAADVPTARLDLLVYLLVVAKCVEPVAAPRAISSGSLPAAPSSGSLPAAPASHPSMPASRPSMPASRPSMPASRPSMPAMRTPSGPLPTVSTDMMRSPPSFRASSMNGIPAARVSAPPAAEPAKPAVGPEELGAAGIAERAQNVEQEDYFEALGVPSGASAEAVRAAYFRLAKLWHPDRLPPELGAVRAEAEKIFAHMTRAQRTLTDPDARRGWLASHAAPERRPRDLVLKEIDRALLKGDFAVAETQSRELVDRDGEDAEARALLAWACVWGGDAPEDALRAALTKLDRAVNADRTCDRALFYRGSLHKKLGNAPAAFRDFARVVALNPKHTDAEREVRLFEMRARRGSGEHALGALVSKLRGKK